VKAVNCRADDHKQKIEVLGIIVQICDAFVKLLLTAFLFNTPVIRGNSK